MEYQTEASARAQSIVETLTQRGGSIERIQSTLTELEIAALAGISGRDSNSNYCRHLAREYAKKARDLAPKPIKPEFDTWRANLV